MGRNQYMAKDAPRRTVLVPVRLTEKEHEDALMLASKYGATVADVMRSGIYSFEREHERSLRSVVDKY